MPSWIKEFTGIRPDIDYERAIEKLVRRISRKYGYISEKI